MSSYTGTYRFWEGTQGAPAIKNSWGTPLSENFALIEAAVGGTVNINVAGLATYTLTTANGEPDQARPAGQYYSGALTGDCTVTLPNAPRINGYAVNITTGGFDIILTTGAGITATIPPDGNSYEYTTDGVGNVTLASLGFGSFSVKGDITFANATGTFVTDTGGTAHQLWQYGADNNADFFVSGAAFWRVLSQSGTLQLFAVDNAGDIYLGPTASANPIGNEAPGWFVAVNGAINGYSSVGTPISIGTGTGTLMGFYFGAGGVGSVTTDGTSVNYNITSDETLKNRLGQVAKGWARKLIDGISVEWITWKSDAGAEPQPSFIAQQLHKWFPWAVTKGVGVAGDKDFQPWQVDQSKLLALVIADLKDIHARLDER